MKIKKKIAFESYPDFSNNTKVLYDYFVKHYPDDYEYFWLITDKNNIENFNTKNIKTLSYEDNNFECEFNSIDLIFSTHNNYISYKKSHQVWFCLWHGGGFKIQGYLNELDKYNICAINDKIDYFNTSSQLMRLIFSATFNMKIDKFLEFGQPRSNCLFDSDGYNNLLKVTKKDVKQFNKILFYLPTYRKGYNREEGFLNENNALNLKFYEEKILLNYLHENNYLLLIKLHPSESSAYKEIEDNNILFLDDKMLRNHNLMLNEVLNACDLIISDYSSVYLDYLKLERPVIFIHTDFNDYMEKRGILFNDYELWFPGPCIENIEQFKLETNKLLNDSSYYLKERQRTNRVVNGNVSNNISENIVDFVINKIFNDSYIYVKKLEFENKQLQNKLKENYNELSTMNNQLYLKNQELEVVNKLYDSFSWKVTFPLRKIKSIIIKTRKDSKNNI